MIEQKVTKTGNKLERATLFLKSSLKESSAIDRRLEKKSLALKKKIVEDRGRTLKRLASGGRDKGTGGVLGGALNILGLGAGAGGLRMMFRGVRKTPTPTKLLNVQRGTSISSLGKVGRIGRLARPIAVVGAGLDFVGRKTQGQTNTQAGAGAAGGFAGGLAGAKVGATFGSLAGPIGSVVGGAGGAIIGSLAGGRAADLFTGANRRRQFEEERVQVRTAESLFSSALDDFDKVLNKFENFTINFEKRRDRPESNLPRIRNVIPKFVPRSFREKNFFDKNKKLLEALGFIAISSFAASRGVPTPKKMPVKIFDARTTANDKVFQKIIKENPNLKDLPLNEQFAGIGRIFMRRLPKSSQQRVRMSTSPFLNKRGTVVPGQKGAPGKIKKKTNIVKRNLKKKEEQKNIEREQTQKIRESIKDMKDFMEKSGFVEPSKLERRATELFNSDFRDLQIMKSKGQISQAQFDLAVNRLQLNLKITLDRIGQYSDAIREFSLNPKNFDASGNIISKNLNDMVRKLDIFSGKVLPEINMENLIMKNLGPNVQKRLQDIIKRPKQDLIEKIKKEDFGPNNPIENFPDLSSNNLEPSDSTTIASRQSNNVLLMGENGGNTPRPDINDRGGSTIAFLGTSQNTLSVLMLQRQLNQSFTT